eukprot:COSAG01_NODE_1099_length_11701_cov_8.251508_10_plen_191_part_00
MYFLWHNGAANRYEAGAPGQPAFLLSEWTPSMFGVRQQHGLRARLEQRGAQIEDVSPTTKGALLLSRRLGHKLKMREDAAKCRGKPTECQVRNISIPVSICLLGCQNGIFCGTLMVVSRLLLQMRQEQLFGFAPLLARRLLPYQCDGVKNGVMFGGRMLLADEMGLGKTYQALAMAASYAGLHSTGKPCA